MHRILTLLFAVIISTQAASADIRPALQKMIGKPAPDWSLGRTVEGGEKVYLKDMKGKVVVVTFWATWCPPCMAELPVLEAIQKQVSPDLLQVVAVNFMERKKRISLVQEQLPDSDIVFTRDRKGAIGKRYKVRGIPHMVLVNKKGEIANIHVGYGEARINPLIEELNALLAE